MRAVIDSGRCVGHGLCYSVAPSVFEDDEDGYGRVRNDGRVAPADLGAAQLGAANCPESAITVIADGS